MADENSTTTVTEDGELAVKVVNVSGTLVSGPSVVDTTALVQTSAGLERAIKAFPLGEGGGGGGGYVLPPATAETLGGIKVGENLTVEADGTLNAQAGGGASLPSQTGHEGEFLTTDGTDASWGQIPTMLTSGLVPSTSSTVVNTNTPTAPANGWYNITAKSTSSSCYMTSEITSTNPIYLVVSGYPSGMNMNLLVPATKGATYNFGSGSVTDRQIVFVAAEPNDTSLIPSSTSEQQTLQASGSAYEAPETGWFVFSGSSQGTSSVITCEVSTDNPIMQTVGNAPSGYAMAITVPVVKGREYVFSYSSVDNPKLVFVNGLPAKQNAIDPTSISGYDAAKTQVLTNDTGDMKWAEGGASANAIENTATGTDSLTILGTPTSNQRNINIGAETTMNSSTYSVAIGYKAKTWTADSISLGANAYASATGSVALGSANGQGYAPQAGGNYSNAIGFQAVATQQDATQIGRGTNTVAGSLQFRGYQLVDANGKIPADRTAPVAELTTTSVELASDTIYNGTELASVTFTLPSTVPVNFTAQLNFTSGATPTTFTAPSGVIFEGDACSNGTFTPVASKRYSVLIYSDGVNVLGLVMGN